MSGRFLEFSLRFYGEPEVAPACLALQDSCGADVNMLLFAVWAAAIGQRIGESDFAKLEDAARYWRETIIQPLRAVRRALADPPDGCDAAAARALREKVKSAELEGEYRQQEAMERCCLLDSADSGGVPLAEANIGVYAAHLRRTLNKTEINRLMNAFAKFSR